MSELFAHERNGSSDYVCIHVLNYWDEMAWRGLLLIDVLYGLLEKILCKDANLRVCDRKHQREVRSIIE